MKTLNEFQKMTYTIVREIIDGYEQNYFDLNNLENDLEESRYEIIIDWAGLCSDEEYEKLCEDPKVYINTYDAAFDKAVKAALAILKN